MSSLQDEISAGQECEKWISSQEKCCKLNMCCVYCKQPTVITHCENQTREGKSVLLMSRHVRELESFGWDISAVVVQWSIDIMRSQSDCPEIVPSHFHLATLRWLILQYSPNQLWSPLVNQKMLIIVHVLLVLELGGEYWSYVHSRFLNRHSSSCSHVEEAHVSLLLITAVFNFIFRIHSRSHLWDTDCWCWTECDSNMWTPEKLASCILTLDQTCFWKLSWSFRRNICPWCNRCCSDSSHNDKTRAWKICFAYSGNTVGRYCNLLLYKSGTVKDDNLERNISEN